MSARLFLFVQFEFPWPLGPPDGRYLMRSEVDDRPEHVIVLGTVSPTGQPAPRRADRPPGALRRLGGSRQRTVAPAPDPALLDTTRVTIVDPVSLSAERQAKAWLSDLDPARDVPAAVKVLNRVLHAQRIATADPYVREVSPLQASTVRAGWGEGEQVADGHWLHAVELPLGQLQDGGRGRRRRIGGRSAALRPHERLARLLGARDRALLCEELALRARLDLDEGRLAHAALELDRAYAAALVELAGEARADLPLRTSELASLYEGVSAAAAAALSADGAAADAGEPAPERPAAVALDEEALRHALGRLESTLRARSAAGFDRT